MRVSKLNGSAAILALLVAVFTLGACGFKLRSAVEIPADLNPVLVTSNGGSEVRAAILQRLEISEVREAKSAKDARIIVRILGESRSSRVAAVDRDGKVIARELHLRVTFDAVDSGGNQRVERQTLDLVRTYENPDVEVLGKQLEADLIFEDLVHDAADRVLGRLQATLL